MDNTYLTRLSIRKKLIEKERHEVLASNPAASPAVFELYTWLTTIYLPHRFPTLYTLVGPSLQNEATGDLIPLQPTSAEQALELLGSHIDTEFLIMLPTTTPSGTKYCLEAFINCFPNGFNTRSKLNLLLSEIHAPVPGYPEKLEKSMDRFFASLPVGKIVKRFNWGINTNGELFCLAGNHMSEEERERKEREEELEEINLEKTVLRCERQTLHRLPKTKALVFAFKVRFLSTTALSMRDLYS